MSKEILKEWVCKHPFEFIDIQGGSQFVCCPSWCPTDINTQDNLGDNWASPEAQSIRESVMDGSYSHCKHRICPSLSSLINTGKPDGNFIPIKEAREVYRNYDPKINTPKEILFGFDRSCNLYCPSCRKEVVTNDHFDSPEHLAKLKTLNEIDEMFSKTATKMLITGSGDPFYSKLYREYLINFDASKYPELKSIQLITNGNLLTEKMWNSLNAAPFVKDIEVSIDAGTKETYENITRLGGNWDQLIANLRFISTISTLENMMVSMVITEQNFTEMETFYNLMTDIFKDSTFKLHINFRQIVYWGSGAFTLADMNNLQVFEVHHPRFTEFKNELQTIHNKPRVNHNFHHLIK